ncbi:MAG: glucokinase [Gammaproteobacteria bacterium HGW-Gammaproteobacteria-1]|nr:MAG: glucokinase [Gammaproteobacteria bacterium HGW-Gammaproteobacteria-1]
MRVLAGDVGGTKTLLQLAEFDAGATRPQRVLRQARYDSAAYAGLTPLLDEFLRDHHAPLHGACFAVAGPVQDDGTQQHASLTNLPWQLDSLHLGADLGLPAVRLINDFQAVGYGIEALTAEETAVLHDRPAQPRAPRVVLGAGTGLGVALLMPCGPHYEVFPTEAGHADFAPGDAVQDGLLAFLRAELGHVSWERIVSGPGLVNIYRYLLARDGAADAAALLQATDPAAAVAVAAAAATDGRAAAALDLFVRLYGACAGNLALTTLARGGVYLAGGIAAKILPHLQRGGFALSYCDKGRMRGVVDAIPVHVVTNPEVGLLGALLTAARTGARD